MTTQKKTLLVIGMVMLVNALSYGTIIPLLYPFAAKFGISATGLSWLFASFSMAQFVATPIMGRLSDKHGRKPLLLLSLFGTSVSLALFASAQSALMLFTARILDGITGGNISVAQAMLADVTSPKDRAKAFGMLGAIFGFGFVFGPALGGVLSQISLALPFWVASGVALLGTVIGLFLLEETNTHPENKPEAQLFDVHTILNALKAPITGLVLLLGFLSMAAQNGMFITFQSFTVDILKLDAARVGLIFTLFGIVNVVVQGFGIKWLLTTFSNKKHLLNILFLLSGITILWVSLHSQYWWFTISILVYGAFFSPIQAILTSMLSEYTHVEDQGGMLGVNQSLTSIAQIVGPLAAGQLITHDIRWGFWLTGLVLLVCLLATVRLPGHQKQVDL